MEEQFSDIPGYEGRYQVSTSGVVRSVSRFVRNYYSDKVWIQGKNISALADKRGYPRVWLTDSKGKGRAIRIHKAVAITFIPNPENKRTINHKNGIKTDNRVENLEWNTDSENMKHSFKLGLHRGNKGKNNPMFGRKGPSAPGYGKRGKLCTNYGKRGDKSATAKIVLDKETGIFYFGVPEAACAKGVKNFTLYGKLNGRRKNDTLLTYV